jgi:hypothetical protein
MKLSKWDGTVLVYEVFQNLLLLGPNAQSYTGATRLSQDPPRLRLQSVSHVFPRLSSNRRWRATDPLPLSHDSRPFVVSRAVEEWFGQRCSGPF